MPPPGSARRSGQPVKLSDRTAPFRSRMICQAIQKARANAQQSRIARCCPEKRRFRSRRRRFFLFPSPVKLCLRRAFSAREGIFSGVRNDRNMGEESRVPVIRYAGLAALRQNIQRYGGNFGEHEKPSARIPGPLTICANFLSDFIWLFSEKSVRIEQKPEPIPGYPDTDCSTKGTVC